MEKETTMYPNHRHVCNLFPSLIKKMVGLCFFAMCLAIMLAVPKPGNCLEEIPLDLSSWVQNEYQNAPISAGSDGLLLSGAAWTNGTLVNGYTDGNGVLSVASFNHVGTTGYLKLKIDGNGMYLWIQAKPQGLPIPLITTHHSWAGSYVVPENVWLYISVDIDQSGEWTYAIAQNNYADQGGSVLHTLSGTLSQSLYTSLQNAPFIISFNDNYGGVNTSVTLARAAVDDNSPGGDSPSQPDSSGLFVPETAAVSVAYTDTDFILSWPEISNAVQYILYAGLQPDDLWIRVELGNATSFRLVSSYLGGLAVYAKITASDGEDETIIGDVFVVKSPNAFDVPPELFLDSTSEKVRLTWNRVEGADAYSLEYGSEPGSYTIEQEFDAEGFDAYDAPVVSAPVDFLPTGESYFTVRAKKGSQAGPRSNEVSFGRYGAGQNVVLDTGAQLTASPPATGEDADIFFYPVETPPHIEGELLASYGFSSSAELPSTRITLPVTGVSSADDIEVVYLQGATGPAAFPQFDYDASTKTVSVQIENNWTFENIPDPLKGQWADITSDAADNSANLLLVMAKAAAAQSDVNANPVIEMPFFEQSSGTCWASAAMMLRKGSYTAEDGPLSDRRIFQWMANMGIAINDGLSFARYMSYTRLIGGGEVTYSRFFSYNSVKNKIIQLINQGLPVIFARSGHIVLVVGYRYDDYGDLILIQNNSQGTMYEEISFMDSFKENSFFQLVMLTWSQAAPHALRAKQSVGIPTYPDSAFGHIYFTGTDDENHTGKYNLQFDETAQGGYVWSKQGQVGSDFMAKYATELQFEIPVYNADRANSAAVTLWVELYETSPASGSGLNVLKSENITVSPKSSTTVSGMLNLSSIKSSLNQNTAFTLSVSLLDTQTFESTTEVLLEKITLGPAEEETTTPSADAITSDFEGANIENYDRWGIGPMTAEFASGWFQWQDVADYRTSGGNPGGYITWRGDQGDWWFFVTYSSKYRGDRSSALGKKLTFDLRTDNTVTNDFFIPLVVISGTDASGGQMHIFQPQSAYSEPGSTWTSYSIALDASAGWRVSYKSSLTSSAAAANADIQQVLSTLTSIRIRGEYGSYTSRGDLDNVVLGGN